MKVCKICEVEKPLTEFYKSKTHKQGVTNYCKRCTCEIRKKDREENRDKYIEKDRRYFEANTEKVRARSRDYHRRKIARGDRFTRLDWRS